MPITAEDVLMGPFSSDEALHLNGKCTSDCSFCKEEKMPRRKQLNKKSSTGRIRIEAGPLSTSCRFLDVDSGEDLLVGQVQSVQIKMVVGEPVRASLELINVEVSAELGIQEVVAHVNKGPLWQDVDLSRADAIVLRFSDSKQYSSEAIAKFRKDFEKIAPGRPVICITDDLHLEGLVLQRKVSEELVRLRDQVRDLESQFS